MFFSRSHLVLHSSNWTSCSDKKIGGKTLLKDEPLVLVTGSNLHCSRHILQKVSAPSSTTLNTNSKYSKCIITIIIVTATKIIHRYLNWKENFSSLNSWRLPGKGAWSRKPVASTDCEGKHCEGEEEKNQRWNISLVEECYLSGD